MKVVWVKKVRFCFLRYIAVINGKEGPYSIEHGPQSFIVYFRGIEVADYPQLSTAKEYVEREAGHVT